MTAITRRTALAAGLAAAGCATREEPPALALSGPLTWSKLPTTAFRGKQDDVVVLPSGMGWYGNGAGKLYRTANAGADWTEAWSKPGTFIRALGFVDDRLGFLGNIGPGYFPGVTDPEPLYVTRDGGATWTPAAAPSGPKPPGICAIHVHRTPFINAGQLDHRATIRAGGRVGGPAILMTSRDSGASWTSQDLGAQTAMILDVQFTDERTGFICGASSKDVQESRGVILKTRDGGATWREVYRGGRPWELTWKAAFPTKGVGFVTVQSYNPDKSVSQRVVAKTRDGGETWTEQPVVDDHAWRAFGVGFIDERTGWLGGTTTGMQTRDGGVTWTPVEMGKAVNKIRVVRSDAGASAFAIGTEVHKLSVPLRT
jgi:photosystem II stability/assembly factor-like uncharacterized protein